MLGKKIYPSWRYHKTESAKIVNSEAEEMNLGKGWADSPAAFEEKSEIKSEKKEKLEFEDEMSEEKSELKPEKKKGK